MSNTKCYRWKNEAFHADGPWDRFRLVGTDWLGVTRSGEANVIDEANSFVMLHQSVKDGLLKEVPDAPASWPIIDGSPKNPAAFEALYRAAKEAVEQFDYMIELQPEVKDEFYPNCASECDSRREKTTAALALADKGVGQ